MRFKQNLLDTAIFFSGRRQNDPNHNQDYLWLRSHSFDHNFKFDHRIAKSFRQSLHLYHSLVYAKPQLLRFWLGKALVRSRSTIMGNFLFDFGFSKFAGLSPDFGLSFPGIIIQTQGRLLIAWVTLLEVDFWQNLTDFGGTKFWSLDGFHEIPVLAQVMGLSLSGVILDTQVMLLNAWVTSTEVNFWQILIRVGQPYLQPSRGNHGWRFTARIQVVRPNGSTGKNARALLRGRIWLLLISNAFHELWVFFIFCFNCYFH